MFETLNFLFETGLSLGMGGSKREREERRERGYKFNTCQRNRSKRCYQKVGDQEGGGNVRKGSFKNISQKTKFHTIGVYKYQEKQPLVLVTVFFFVSVVSSWLLTSKHKTQE